MADDKPSPRRCWCTPEELATGEHRHRCPAGPLTWIKRMPWGVDGTKPSSDDSADLDSRHDVQ